MSDCLFVVKFYEQAADAVAWRKKIQHAAIDNDVDLLYVNAQSNGIVGIVGGIDDAKRNGFFEFLRTQVIAEINGLSDQPLGSMMVDNSPSKLTVTAYASSMAKWARATIFDVIDGFDPNGTVVTDSDENGYGINSLFGGIGGMHNTP